MLKRTTVFGSPRIINNFKNLCKKNGQVASKVIVEMMQNYVENSRNNRAGEADGKKTKSISRR